MSKSSVSEPTRGFKWIAAILVAFYSLVTIMPLLWIVATGFKSSADSIAYPPKITFQPSLEGYVNEAIVAPGAVIACEKSNSSSDASHNSVASVEALTAS